MLKGPAGHGSLPTRVYSPLISARVVGIGVLSLGTTEPTEHGSSYTPAHAICCSKTGLLRCGTTRQSIAWTGCPREGATGLWDVSQRVSCFVPGLTWFSLRCSLKDSWTLLWSRVVEKPVFGSTGTLFTRYVCMVFYCHCTLTSFLIEKVCKNWTRSHVSICCYLTPAATIGKFRGKNPKPQLRCV